MFLLIWLEGRRAGAGPAETFHRRFERLASAGEMKAQALPSRAAIGVEAGSGHGRDADVLHQVAGEGDVVGESKPVMSVIT